MKALASLFAILFVGWAVERMIHPSATGVEVETMRAVMDVGVIMLGGWLSGKLAERFQVPAITGYMVFGVLIGPEILGFVEVDMVEHNAEAGVAPLQFASDLAIALIALTAGIEIRLDFLRGKLHKLFAVLSIHMLVILLAVALTVFAGRGLVPMLQGTSDATIWVIAVLCSVVMLAVSPAVTIAMITDYKASGPLSQSTLVIAVLKDIILIVLFAVTVAISKGVLLEHTTTSTAFFLSLAFQLVGSLVIGALFGLAMAGYVKYIGTHLLIFLVGSCLLIALLGEHGFHDTWFGPRPVHLEPLLMALAAGLLMQNLWPQRCKPLFRAMELLSLPVYCLFFSLAAAKIHLDTLSSLWIISLALVIVRMVATWAGITMSLRVAAFSGNWPRYLWLGMISQAGVSLVLVTLIAEAFSTFSWALPLKEVLVGAIFINQIIGPILFRHGLLSSGEGVRPAV